MREAEKLLNNHARSWVGAFRIGDSTNQKRRCSRALISNYVTIPVLQGLRKDHKPDRNGDPILGPKLRPLCAANRAPNAALCNLVAKSAKALGDSISHLGGEIISCEELKQKIEDVNRDRAGRSYIHY